MRWERIPKVLRGAAAAPEAAATATLRAEPWLTRWGHDITVAQASRLRTYWHGQRATVARRTLDVACTEVEAARSEERGGLRVC